jgi:general secretion pathway protein G
MINNNSLQGFTLIEVMVVVVILGILAAFMVPRITGHTDDAREVKVKHDLQTLKTALELYKLDNYVYPTTDQSLQALVTKPTIPPEPRQWREGGYLDAVPQRSLGISL